MYLSRVKIDIENRKKMKKLNHLGAYHHWVEQCFPSEMKRGERTRKLWRIDLLEGNQYLLVVSEKKPDLEQLETYGIYNSAESKDYDLLMDRLAEGDRLRFRVKLNPIKSRSEEHTSELQSRGHIVCRLLLEKKK